MKQGERRGEEDVTHVATVQEEDAVTRGVLWTQLQSRSLDHDITTLCLHHILLCSQRRIDRGGGGGHTHIQVHTVEP